MFCTWDMNSATCIPQHETKKTYNAQAPSGLDACDILVEKIDVMFSACVEAQGFPAHARKKVPKLQIVVLFA